MPPGWDGIETIEHLWEEDPDLQCVICSAYFNCSWFEITEKLGASDQLLILKKPFDPIEVIQIAHAFSRKWVLHRQVQQRTLALEEANAKLKAEIISRQHMEMELRLVQKLEAVGQLAAGIAHEINTPIQYVGDSIHFLKTAFEDLQTLTSRYQDACAALVPLAEHAALLEAVREAEEIADLPYLQENMPRAFERTLEGIGHVANIVRAMKEFTHPDQRHKSPANINKAILNTLAVARHEYKYVAEVETELSELPPVICYVGDLNQVFLNLIVNAAHAIAEVVGDNKTKRRILIRTTNAGNMAEITIADSGCGIPEEIRQRVFDPFFTTKPVGKGTGQGLAIARSIVVDKHGGTLTFESRVGQGTTFLIRLPVDVQQLRQCEVAV
jgi:signal transduction histidine kinase